MHITSLLTGATLVASTLALPFVPVHPKGPRSIIITSKNTLNATAPPPRKGIVPQPNANAALPVHFVNNLAGGSVNAYVTGLDPNGRLVFVQANGQFLYPSCQPGTGVPQPIYGALNIPLGGQGSTTSVTFPNYISSGRIWFAEGSLNFYTVCGGNGYPNLVEPSSTNPSDPNANTNWGFAEFTNNNGGLFADISYVDFLGMPIGISMVAGDGSTQIARGVPANAVATLCSQLSAQQSRDGQPWGDLCQTSNGVPIRAIAPFDYISVNNNAFSNYYDNYVNQVWNYYSSNTLTINTQESYGDVACRVSGGVLTCAGDNGSYNKPTSADIFGCNSGPFALNGQNGIHYAVVPRLCAAFDRSTLLLSNGNIQPNGPPESTYYTPDPTNYYSKYIHQLELDGKGYAYAYDDVTPSGGAPLSGTVSDGNPQSLTVTVGGE